MLKTRVKAGGITTLTDARYFAAWEVEWLGFALDPSSVPHLSPQQMLAIREWVEGVRIVGEFNLRSAEELAESIPLLDLDDLCVGPLTSESTLAELSSDIPVIKELLYEAEQPEASLISQMDQFAPYAAFFQLSLDKQGIGWKDLLQGRPFGPEQLKEWCSRYPLLIGLSDYPADLSEILDGIRPAGLSVQGGEEEQVGYKSFEELDSLFESLEVLEE